MQSVLCVISLTGKLFFSQRCEKFHKNARLHLQKDNRWNTITNVRWKTNSEKEF
jgi:hypothetical protein